MGKKKMGKRDKATSEWHDLNVGPNELRPEFSLTTGQCFNWRPVVEIKIGEEKILEWTGVIGNRVISLRQTEFSTLFRCLNTAAGETKEVVRSFLFEYFQLHTSLASLYQEWAAVDERTKIVAACIPGVRVVRQDPVECLSLSFARQTIISPE